MQKIKVFNTVESLQLELNQLRKSGVKIGFVPTMGALHEGHVTLVEEAKKYADIVVVSVFVNPTQFNNSDDLLKYPRTIESDISKLEAAAVEIVFVPSVDEIYPQDYENSAIDLGILGTVMEGHYRPGHFDGVVQVVKRLFEIVAPSVACFGKKDFQQLAVIRYMTSFFQFNIEIIGCEIKREVSGLAMSSRNMRLSPEQKEDALHIYRILHFVKENTVNFSPKDLAQHARTLFYSTPLELEYLEIVDGDTLVSLTDTWVKGATCCIACYCGEVRLIDNMEL